MTNNPFLLEHADFAVSRTTKIAPFVIVRHSGFLLAERSYIKTSVEVIFGKKVVPIHQKLVRH